MERTGIGRIMFGGTKDNKGIESMEQYLEHHLFSRICKGLLEGKNVLIIGETDTGKATILRDIILSTKDRLGPFKHYGSVEEIGTETRVKELNAMIAVDKRWWQHSRRNTRSTQQSHGQHSKSTKLFQYC